MKKKILGGVAAIAIAALAAFNMDVDNKQELSAISLANVEALANGETGGEGGTFICYHTYELCHLWDCTTIYKCDSNCAMAKVSYWSNPGTCGM